MLAITADAAEVIRELSESGAGALRISTGPYSMNGGGPAVNLELVPNPAPEDEVVDADGVQVFVDPVAVPALDHKLLDAETQGTTVQFELREQD
jgi:Fe-S cluster assembly iron-binding protein IscA